MARRLQFADGESKRVLVVDEPVVFELPRRPGELCGSRLYVVNCLTDVRERDCAVWQVSPSTFDKLPSAPYWVTVTRHGGGRRNTYYEVEPERPADPCELSRVRRQDLAGFARQQRAKWLPYVC
jgi:hypothetical protein